MSWIRASLSVVFSVSLVNIATAQGVPAAAPQDNLPQQLNDQLRRIAALEAQLARLQQEIEELRGSSLQRHDALDLPPAHVQHEEPFEHAVADTPPHETDPEAPAGDLPRALPVDAYGSLRVATALDAKGHSEIRNNATRIGLRGEKR